MALTNESYIVNTQTTGDIIVPVKEQVQYLNIQLLGYQYYKYHEVMSQNLANIVDDIKSLQDGGLAQATFDLDALVSQSMQLISDEVQGLESGILAKIVTLTDEAVTETRESIAAFTIKLDGGIDINNNTVVGVVPEVTSLRATVGDDAATYGLTKKVQTLHTVVGDDNSGLVQQVNNYTDLITDLAAVSSGDHNTLTTLPPRITNIENTIGSESSGLIQEVTLNTNRIFGGGGFDGIIPIIGTVSDSGMLHDIAVLRQDLDFEIALSDDRLDTLEPKLPIIETKIQGFTEDINRISDDLGTDDNSGVRQRVFILEQQDVPALKQVVSGATTGHTDLISALRTELDAAKGDIDTLEATASSSTSSLESDIGDTNSAISANTSAIATVTSDLNSLETGKVKDNADAIVSLANGQVQTNKTDISNMPNTIQEGILKYSSSLTFNTTILKAMYDTTQLVDTSDVIAQFKTYFESGGAYINIDQIGKEHLILFINDTSADGFKPKTYSFITDYLSEHSYSLSQIESNRLSIETLNADATTTGSVAKDIYDATHPIEQKLAYLESTDPTESRSINSIAKTHTDALATSLATTEFPVIDGKIIANTNLISTLKTNTDVQLDEVKVEHARYDTLLPFMQKMFKYLNTPGSITDDQIDEIFTEITTKVEQVAIDSGAKQLDYDLLILPGISEFKVRVILDRDLKFNQIEGAPADTYVLIYRAAPGDPSKEAYSANVFEPTDTDSLGRLIVQSGVLDISLSSNMYLISDQSDDGAVVDLNGENSSIELIVGTVDVFGQHKEIHVPVRI